LECWNYGSPVRIKRRTKLAMWAEKYKLLSALPGIAPRKFPLVRPPNFKHRYKSTHAMDFARGVAELASAVRESRESRLSAAFSLHVNEIVLAMQHPAEMGSPRVLASTFDAVQPMPWALGANEPAVQPATPLRLATRPYRRAG
jgi:hypothetical protein